MKIHGIGLVALVFVGARWGLAQHYQSDFPPEEFKARWAKVFEKIGGDAVAVLQGMSQTDGFIYPRQYNSLMPWSFASLSAASSILRSRKISPGFAK